MATPWTTADYALIVSLCSVAISLIALLWNIWSKWIYPKPKIGVTLSHSIALGAPDHWPDAITLTATNFGPIEVSLKQAIGYIAPSWFFGKSMRAVMKAYSAWPGDLRETAFGETPGLPLRLPVGETFSVNFSVSVVKTRTGTSGSNLHRALLNLGFQDGFGREHFADRKSKRLLREFRKEEK